MSESQLLFGNYTNATETPIFKGFYDEDTKYVDNMQLLQDDVLGIPDLSFLNSTPNVQVEEYEYDLLSDFALVPIIVELPKDTYNIAPLNSNRYFDFMIMLIDKTAKLFSFSFQHKPTTYLATTLIFVAISLTVMWGFPDQFKLVSIGFACPIVNQLYKLYKSIR